MSTSDFDKLVREALDRPPTSATRYQPLVVWLSDLVGAIPAAVNVSYVTGGSKNLDNRLRQRGFATASALGLLLLDDVAHAEGVAGALDGHTELSGPIAVAAESDDSWQILALHCPSDCTATAEALGVAFPELAVTGDTGKRDVADALQRVLDLQAEYASKNTPEMAERGDLIRSEIPGHLQEWLDVPWMVQGSDGIGRKARVPWVRIYDPALSPRATSGWYVVFLFAEDGSSVYLSLNQGTQIPTRGGRDLKSKPRDQVEGAALRARDSLELTEGSSLTEALDLGSSKLAGDYAAGSVAAFRYDKGEIPGDAVLSRSLLTLLSMNSELEAVDSSDATKRALAVYVGSATGENLTHGLAEGIWGWKNSHADYGEVQANDLVVFGVGYTGGSPRKQSEDFAVHGFDRVVECEISSVLTEQSEPTWPDEIRAGKLIYPHRFGIRRVRELGGMTVDELNARYGADIGEALRVSGSSGGRGVLVEVDYGDPQAEVDISGVSLADVCAAVDAALRDSGLDYGQRHESLIRAFVVSLATKRLALLTGLSGSGKTRLALAFGQWLGAERYKVVAVRPDWTGPDALLGYENQLSESQDGAYAWVVPETLEFMLRASRDSKHPYLLILDEMNLAHVERYFADVLSGIESNERILPDLVKTGGEWRPVSDHKLPFPSNLFVAGTVNIDETTYMFSPKVLDRSNTLEFRVLTDDLNSGGSGLSSVDAGADVLVARFLCDATGGGDSEWQDRYKMADALRGLHELLSEIDREFGHRVFQEALRFGSLLSLAGEEDWMVALDLQVMQKVLPRFHGSVRQVADPLRLVASWCFHGPVHAASKDFDPQSPPDGEPVLPVSYDKVARMHKQVMANHFVSFAE